MMERIYYFPKKRSAFLAKTYCFFYDTKNIGMRLKDKNL